ncbi:MAG: hypothetical protein PVJ49_03590 [Acidobacteriota bacterium]|jgi:hypothetical protein
MIDLALLVGALTISAVALYRSGAVRDWAALAAAAPAIALGALSLAAFGLLFIGVALHPLSVSVAFGVVLGYVVIVCRRFPAAAKAETARVDSGYMSPSLFAAALMLLVSTVSLTWAGRQWIAAWPHGSADAVNIWTSRALLLSRTPGDLPERFAWMPQGHPDYPLMVPTVVAAQFGGTGSESLIIPQATTCVWLAAVIIAAFALTTELSNAKVGCLAAAVVAANPLLARWGFTQCADVPLAYMLLLFSGAIALLLSRDQEAPFPVPLIGFFGGLLMWIKTEGTVVGAVLIAFAALLAWQRREEGSTFRRRVVPFAIGIAPPLTVLVLFRAFWIRGVETPSFLRADWLERLTDVDRWRLLLSTAAYETAFYGRMRVSAAIVLASLAVAAIVVIARRGNVMPAARFLLLPVAVAWPIYTIAYMLSPYELQWHVSTSVDRLVLHVMPTVLVATTLLLATRAHPDSAPVVGGDGGPGGSLDE